MSFHLSDMPRFKDELRQLSDELQEIKDRILSENEFSDDDRHPRADTFSRPLPRILRGFPFDSGFERPRGNDIRAHLDDLAARNPEFAEHLRGPPWPFGGSLLRDRRRRLRRSGGSNDEQPQEDQAYEDTQSQESGSSAASGASGVSSHSGERNLTSSIPQYGLRNTVDIGQQQRRRDMETSSEKDERGQRSMSAPPESWQQPQPQPQPQGQDQQLPHSGQGQKFVSRVDITPQHNQQQQRSQSPSKPASNVRHIPIFVEGRDTPVMPKIAADDVLSSTFQRQPSPPSHHFDRSSSPVHHFHRPSHFNERFNRQQWPPSHFQDAFYKPAGFEQPTRRHQFPQQSQQPQYQQYYQQPQHQQPQQHYEQHYQHQKPQQSQPHQEEQQQQQQQQQHEEAPKPKPIVPKDPLEKVAQVQKEVDDLAQQVRRYVGGSRQDKEYIYLDEMLTRELIKLDDIETEGRENVRQARKNAIKTIQETISLLETKAPIANQQEQQLVVRKEAQESSEKDQRKKEISQVSEPMEIDTKQDKPINEPIPLPPGPSSPTKKMESSDSEGGTGNVESGNQSVVSTSQQDPEQKLENLPAENTEQFVASATDESAKPSDEIGKESILNDGGEGKDSNALRTENKPSTEAGDKQLNSTESPKQQKKIKKTKKKQQPVSEAIPLPPPPPPPPTESEK